MKIGKSDKLFSNFEVNGRSIVMSRNGINGAARPIKNCSRQDVYEAMADIYNEFYFKEIDTDRMIPIEWLRMWFTKKGSLIGIILMGEIESDWEKENETSR